MTQRKQNIIIVGGGAIGCSIAFFLKSDPAFNGEVTVVERDPTYARASSALSASSIRQQFSTPVNIALSRFGFEFLQNAPELLAVGDDKPALALHEGGYLVMAGPDGGDSLKQIHAIQKQQNAPIILLNPDELAEKFPWLNTDGISFGTLGVAKEGWFDGYGLLQGFRKKARALGVKFVADEVTGFKNSGDTITAVELKSGGTLACGSVVNACGPWAGKLGELLGVDVPVRARKRNVFVFTCKNPPQNMPLLGDPSGFWVRHEGDRFICGTTPKHGEPDPDDLPLEVDYQQFDDVLWPALAQRVPAFENIKQTGAWAGYYEVNPIDHNGLAGRHPARSNLYLACGFSGHGLQHAPGIGRGMAELLVHGAYSSIDLTALSYERIERGQPMLEINVI